MAANSIGNAALVLSTDGQQLTQGLSTAGSQIKAWGDKTASSTKGSFGGIGSAIGGLLTSGIGLATGGVGLLVGTMIAAITAPAEKLQELLNLDKQAKTIGVSASELQGMGLMLQKVGVDANGANQVFALMGKNIADASQGHGRAFPALQALGIDAKALLNLPLTEQFKAIGDAINKLPPGAEQAQAALHIFGGEGARLLPILQKGSVGIDEFITHAKSTGAVLSDAQIKQGADAQRAVKESSELIKQTWDGLIGRVTVAIAPVVKFWANAFQKGFELITPIFDWLSRAWEEEGLIITAVFTKFGEWVQDAIDWAKELTSGWGLFGDQFPTIKEVVRASFLAMGLAGAVVWDSLKAGAGAVSISLGYLVKGIGWVWNAFADLINLAQKIPEDVRPKWVDDFTNSINSTRVNINTAGNGLVSWGDKQIASWGSSLTKVNDWFAKIGTGTVAKVADGAKVALQNLQAMFKPVQAALKGSKEDYEIRTKATFDAKWGTDAATNMANKALAEQKLTNQKLDKINDAIKNGIVLGVF